MNLTNLQQKVSDFISPVKTTLSVDHTVDDALAHIRKQQLDDQIFYLYVIDQQACLKGVVSTRNLLLSPAESKIEHILEDTIVSISSEHSLQQAKEILTQHRLLAVPVVDGQNRFLGVIDIQLYLGETVDINKAKTNSTDLFQLLGLHLEESKPRSTWLFYRTRMPWIFCNMVGGIACAIISRVYEMVLLEVILLAMFIPLVLTLSESISMQSMTYSLQLIHRPKVSFKRYMSQILSETKMVSLLALTSGLIVGGLSLLWREGWRPPIAIAAGIIISVTISGAIGAAMPLLLHARKLDPKVAAGPVVLMLADVITTTIYLGISTWWLL
ncbi:MAG: magnesium transporter [Verrucomicrobia bacterium]|nr:magnesium transporter [Verrucomicrobiota bacterium]